MFIFKKIMVRLGWAGAATSNIDFAANRKVLSVKCSPRPPILWNTPIYAHIN